MGSVQQLRGEWHSLHTRQQQISDLFESLLAKKNRQISSRTIKLQAKEPLNHSSKPRASPGPLQKTAKSQQRLSTLTASHEKLAQTLATKTSTGIVTASPQQTPKPVVVSVDQLPKQPTPQTVRNPADTHEKEVLTDPTPQSTQLSQTEHSLTEHAESQTQVSETLETSTQTTVAEEERKKEEANNKRKLDSLVDNVDELLLHLISSFKKNKETLEQGSNNQSSSGNVHIDVQEWLTLSAPVRQERMLQWRAHIQTLRQQNETVLSQLDNIIVAQRNQQQELVESISHCELPGVDEVVRVRVLENATKLQDSVNFLETHYIDHLKHTAQLHNNFLDAELHKLHMLEQMTVVINEKDIELGYLQKSAQQQVIEDDPLNSSYYDDDNTTNSSNKNNNNPTKQLRTSINDNSNSRNNKAQHRPKTPQQEIPEDDEQFVALLEQRQQQQRPGSAQQLHQRQHQQDNEFDDFFDPAASYHSNTNNYALHSNGASPHGTKSSKKKPIKHSSNNYANSSGSLEDSYDFTYGEASPTATTAEPPTKLNTSLSSAQEIYSQFFLSRQPQQPHTDTNDDNDDVVHDDSDGGGLNWGEKGSDDSDNDFTHFADRYDDQDNDIHITDDEFLEEDDGTAGPLGNNCESDEEAELDPFYLEKKKLAASIAVAHSKFDFAD